MLTVKLTTTTKMKIMEAQTVTINPVGKPTINQDKEAGVPPCTNAVKEIVLTTNGHSQSVFVGYEGAESIADPVELWDCAYIENAHGATTERVYGQP